jgi:hypothetical protein
MNNIQPLEDFFNDQVNEGWFSKEDPYNSASWEKKRHESMLKTFKEELKALLERPVLAGGNGETRSSTLHELIKNVRFLADHWEQELNK